MIQFWFILVVLVAVADLYMGYRAEQARKALLEEMLLQIQFIVIELRRLQRAGR